MHEHCDACGFDGAEFDDAALLAGLGALGQQWAEVLAAAGEDLRTRPAPHVWSAIEYAAHSRDVIAIHVYGVREALTGSERVFPPVGDPPDPGAEPGLAALGAPAVAAALGTNAERLAGTAADAGTPTWSRGITVGEARSDVRRMLEHVLHDSRHHLDDVQRGLALIRSSR